MFNILELLKKTYLSVNKTIKVTAFIQKKYRKKLIFSDINFT